LLEQYIKAATAYGETLTGRKFAPTVYQLDLDSFTSGNIYLRPNLISVSSVTYLDENEVEQEFTDYTVKSTGIVGYIAADDGWPGGTDVVIEFTAGFAIDGVPEDLRAWIMVKVADFYTQRESFIQSRMGAMGVVEMPKSFIDNILYTHIVPGVGAGL